MFWFDKQNPNTIFADIRNETHTLCDGRLLEIKPDVVADFTKMPFDSCSFKLVVFDPPHLKDAGNTSWIGKKYGCLGQGWEDEIKKGFSECFRVLEENGILIFKWSEDQIKVSQVLKLTDRQPLFGHRSGKSGKTMWLCFMKL
jgi:ubiquinone/menaquinone biosynthesis C-methylase UbiE